MPITVDEFKELIQNPEASKELLPILKAAGFETPDDIQGLKAKNNEILVKMKKINEEKTNLQKLIDDPDYQEYIANKDNPIQQTQNSGNEEYDKLQREYKKLSIDLKKLSDEKAQLAEDKTKIESIFFQDRIDTQLSAALDAAGFDPEHKSLLQQALRGKAKIDNTDGKYTAILEDELGFPLPAKEYAMAFAGTDSGKRYLKKPENRGAGSQGFNDKSNSSKGITREQFDKMTPAEKAANASRVIPQ